jgi:hypothetical protein
MNSTEKLVTLPLMWVILLEGQIFKSDFSTDAMVAKRFVEYIVQDLKQKSL